MVILKKAVWNWKFKILDHENYDLIFCFSASNKYFTQLFNKTVGIMRKRLKKSISTPGVEDVKRIDVTPNFYNLLNVYLKKPFKLTAAEIAEKHGFKFLDFLVYTAYFVKEDLSWKIYIKVSGLYTK